MSEKLAKYKGLSNMWGDLQVDIIDRIEAFLENPCAATWDRAYSIIIVSYSVPVDLEEGRPAVGRLVQKTFWQCVIEVDPAFPKSAKMDEYGTTGWEKIPDFFTARRALKYAQKINRGG